MILYYYYFCFNIKKFFFFKFVLVKCYFKKIYYLGSFVKVCIYFFGGRWVFFFLLFWVRLIYVGGRESTGIAWVVRYGWEEDV